MSLNTVREIVCKKDYLMEDGDAAFKAGKVYRFIFSDDPDTPFLFLENEWPGVHHMPLEDVEEHFYLRVPDYLGWI